MQITNPRRFRLFIAAFVAVVAGTWWYVNANPPLAKTGVLEVASGTSATATWRALVDQGFTSRTLPWRYQAWRLSAAANIKAGQYQLEAGERVRNVVQRLVAGDTASNDLTITYPEGFTIQQMAERTAARGIGNVDSFIAAAVPESYVAEFPWLADMPEARTLEGYLFPDTYKVFPDDEPGDVIRRMLATFDQKVPDDRRASAAEKNRTLDQIVIMASIIEREVLSDDDMALVSGVLWKRHDEGLGLDADATIRFTLNKWDEPLTVQDLATDSPYNTRKWRGLPPGPISNPGLRALTAALEPQESEYYYYLSAPSGETIFSRTNDEHNANKAKYLR